MGDLILDNHFCFLHFFDGDELVVFLPPTQSDLTKSSSAYDVDRFKFLDGQLLTSFLENERFIIENTFLLTVRPPFSVFSALFIPVHVRIGSFFSFWLRVLTNSA